MFKTLTLAMAILIAPLIAGFAESTILSTTLSSDDILRGEEFSVSIEAWDEAGAPKNLAKKLRAEAYMDVEPKPIVINNVRMKNGKAEIKNLKFEKPCLIVLRVLDPQNPLLRVDTNISIKDGKR